MKQVTFAGCNHTGETEDTTYTMPGEKVMAMCPRCLAVATVDDLFVGYPCGYRTRYKSIMAVVKEIRENEIIVATSQAQPGQLTYQEWTVAKSDFRKKGQLLNADPFGVLK